MSRGIVTQGEIREIFDNLREDVRLYFEKFEMIPGMYNPNKTFDSDDYSASKEHSTHKLVISLLCGNEARIHRVNDFDGDIYHNSILYLNLIMGVVK